MKKKANDLMQVFFFHVQSLGGENLAVAQNTYSVTWFKGKELNLVFGLQLSISRVVSFTTLSNNIYPFLNLPKQMYTYSYEVLNVSSPIRDCVTVSNLNLLIWSFPHLWICARLVYLFFYTKLSTKHLIGIYYFNGYNSLSFLFVTHTWI